VGVRFYAGYASEGEHVALKRQPENRYDPNAIRVDNVMGQQIGHIPRNMAAKLAKYMVNKPRGDTSLQLTPTDRMKGACSSRAHYLAELACMTVP
jgi:hypothetical protein